MVESLTGPVREAYQFFRLLVGEQLIVVIELAVLDHFL